MNKLLKKYCHIVDADEGFDNLGLAEKLEQITDDFASKFAVFLDKYKKEYKNVIIIEELLQIFKNEYYE